MTRRNVHHERPFHNHGKRRSALSSSDLRDNLGAQFRMITDDDLIDSEPDRRQAVKAGVVALPLRGFGLDGLARREVRPVEQDLQPNARGRCLVLGERFFRRLGRIDCIGTQFGRQRRTCCQDGGQGHEYQLCSRRAHLLSFHLADAFSSTRASASASMTSSR